MYYRDIEIVDFYSIIIEILSTIIIQKRARTKSILVKFSREIKSHCGPIQITCCSNCCMNLC